jgi:hypothetical protein
MSNFVLVVIKKIQSPHVELELKVHQLHLTLMICNIPIMTLIVYQHKQ